jgi:hypothetical protein
MAKVNDERSATLNQTWDLITGTVTCFLSGSFLLLTMLTLQFNDWNRWIGFIVGFVLMVVAPIMLITTFFLSWTPFGLCLFRLVKPTMNIVALASLLITAFRVISIFGGNGWQAIAYAWLVTIFLVFFVAAGIINIIRVRIDKSLR